MTNLHIETLGPQDAEVSLLFMHGTGLDHTYYRPYVDDLSDRYRLVFYDDRQHGRSPRNAHDDLNIDQMASDAAGVARATGCGTTVVIAHSSAAWVAIRAALMPDSFVHATVLVSPGLSSSVGRVLAQYLATSGTGDQQAVVASAFGGDISDDASLADAFRSVFPLYFCHRGREATAEMVNRSQVSALGFNQFLSFCFGSYDWKAAVRALQVPCLVIGGSNDWLETDDETAAKTVAGLARFGSLAMLPDAAHFPFIEQPEAFARTLRSWLVLHSLV